MMDKEKGTAATAVDFQKIDCSEQAFLSRRIPFLNTLHNRLTKNAEQALSALIKTPCTITPSGLQSRFFCSYFQQQVPAACYAIQLSPIDSEIFVLLDQNLVYNTLERAFGGTGNAPVRASTQMFTSVEAAIIQPLLSGLCKQLQSVFNNILPLNFTLKTEQINLSTVQHYQPKALMAACLLELSVKNHTIGQLTLLWPYDLLVDIQDTKIGPIPRQQKEAKKSFKNNLTEALGRVKLGVKAMLGNKHIALGEVPRWKVGDLIALDCPADPTLTVESIPLFTVKLGNTDDKYALKIVDKV